MKKTALSVNRRGSLWEMVIDYVLELNATEQNQNSGPTEDSTQTPGGTTTDSTENGQNLKVETPESKKSQTSEKSTHL